MSRSSARRAQVEPLAALAAVFAVGAGLAVYATTLGTTVPEPDRDRAGPALASVSAAVVEDGVARPANVARAPSAGPDGYRVRVVLTAGDRTWTAGPESPPDAATASRRVGVALAPGRVEPGRLRVEVWT